MKSLFKYLTPAALIAAGFASGPAVAAPLSEGPGASNVVQTPRVTTQLIAERGSIRPGQSVAVVLDQKVIDHWHTYWQNPGDTGLPTRIKWTLPAGWSAGPIKWPTPERMTVGPIVNYGYEGKSRLLSELRAPANLATGVPVSIVAEVSWLVCEKICIPERAKLTLQLGTDASANGATPGAAAIFREARAALPRGGADNVTFVQDGSVSALAWPASGAVQSAVFFPDSNDMLAPTVEQKRVVRDGMNHLVFAQAPKLGGRALQGILSINGRGTRISLMPSLAASAAGTPLPSATGSDVAPDALASQAGVSPSDQDPNALASGNATAAVAGSAALPSASEESSSMSSVGIWQAILFAMLGGMVLNLMPCVFPVLSLKAMSIVKQGPEQARIHSAAYTGGVVVSFLAIAGVLLALRAGGSQIGWGFQLQSPIVVTILVYVMLLLGLSLSGVFTLGGSSMGLASKYIGREGLTGSFLNGVLASVVAAPCTAPFMGAAVGYALLQDWWKALAVFAALGIGMALPLVALVNSKTLVHRIPKPGMWMERLKQLLAFPLYATAAWLVWVFTIQTGTAGLAVIFTGCLLVAIGAYLYGQTFKGAWAKFSHVVVLALAAGAIALPLTLIPERNAAAAAQSTATGEVATFSEAAIKAELQAGKPVFVDFTAAWCITCLANERSTLSREAVKQEMQRKGVTFMVADWTNQDANITVMLERYGRAGVPLYLLFSPSDPDRPKILPQILNESIVLDHLKSLPDHT